VALRGIVFGASGTLATTPLFQTLQARIKDKQARLLFEREARDPRGNLSAYVYLSDRTLLNEEVLRLGFGRLDTSVDLSPQYHRRLKKAEEFARESRVGIWAGLPPEKQNAPSKTPYQKLSKPRGSLFGVPRWSSTFDREKRSRED